VGKTHFFTFFLVLKLCKKVVQILGPLTRLWGLTDIEKDYIDRENPQEMEQFQKIIT